MATHYVDNKKLYEVIIEYKNQSIQAKKEKKEKPVIPNYVGQCIMMIATRLSFKPNFVNYSFRDEMISDGVENCVSYFDNFDPAKSSNPFAYFTQIIYYAFLRRIQKEKKQSYIKHKATENSMLFDLLLEHNQQENSEGHNSGFIDENVSDFIKSFEINITNKKTKRKKAMDVFFNDEKV